MTIPLLNDILIIFAISIVVLFVCHRLHLSPIVGFLLTGLLAGPHGLGLIQAVHDVEVLAEVGMVFLLFSVGIEFSIKYLMQIKRAALLGGSIQVILTVVATALIARQFGQPVGQSIFIGFLVALSSTVITLKLLQERAEMDTPQGRTGLAMLIFQDVITVPMILFTPLLAGDVQEIGQPLLLLLVKGVGVIGMVVLAAKWLMPWLLYQIAQTRSREVFLLGIILICLAVAWLTSKIGLSLALGAFFAGLIISESAYGNQALSSVLPFRDVFVSFFFVSVGMLLDIQFVVQHPGLILATAVSVFVLKASLASLATALLGFPLRTALLTGLMLAQIGEFSFVLAKIGIGYRLLEATSYQLFLAVSVLTMAVSPLVMAMAPRLVTAVLRWPWPERLRSGLFPALPQGADAMTKVNYDHLIIVGFGLNGRNVARAADASGIPYLIIEINPETVRKEQAKGQPIFYGDAVQQAVLEHAGIRTARVLVVAISDPAATRRIIELARSLNPNLYIIARTRFLQEMKPLLELGASEVIPEEFETSIEIFTRVLAKYLVPKDDIERFIAEVRADGYQMLRRPMLETASINDVRPYLTDVQISTLRLDERSAMVGQTLGQLALRKKYGVTVVAIRRQGVILANPDAEARLEANDQLIVLGNPENIATVTALTQPPDHVSQPT
ncbi:MAG: cation:proton antiporter [Acidobacteriota bacterium]|nr:cation:proton antiporter [Blastocatellia bacterium]MDW8239802.1 cation:proton antiporter [Acidobacteriota bacterium]